MPVNVKKTLNEIAGKGEPHRNLMLVLPVMACLISWSHESTIQLYERDPEKIAGLRDEAHTALTVLDKHLANRTYVCGDAFTMGDKKYDVFNCGNNEAPVLIYFHGGYWQRGDKSIYSFLAEPFVAAGVNVVVVGYDLCPDVSLTIISEQAREAVADIYRKASELGFNQKKLAIMGHSAGGHIAEMMMGTDWNSYATDLPADLINVGIPVSPLSLLEPVRLTVGLNAGIRMDEAEAESQSPMLNHPPVTNAAQMVLVGGAETDEFHRQAQMYVDKLKSKDRAMELYVVPDVDHFDELNVLADPKSPFFSKTLAFIS